MEKYIDKNGMEIKVGMRISIAGDKPEEVFATVDPFGRDRLEINASNPRYLAAHPTAEQEFYPLTEFQHIWVDNSTIQMTDSVIVEGEI